MVKRGRGLKTGKSKKKGDKEKSKRNTKKKDALKNDFGFQMAVKNSNVWETRVNIADIAREHYRDAAKELATENEDLREQMKQIEKDTIDVVAYLKNQDTEKENEVLKLQQELKVIRSEHQKEKDEIIDDFNRKIRDYDDRLLKKTNDYTILKNELTQVKEFRKKKLQMQKELEEIKEAMVWNEKEHKDQVTRIEQKFFEEKMRLQQESNKKIEELAEKAHDEAIKNLDEATRNIYKENTKLTESLKLNINENENLKNVNQLLYEDNATLKSDLELHKHLVHDKVDVAQKQAKQIKDLQGKIEVLEKSLSQVVKEFESERQRLVEKFKIESESSTIELKKLRKMLDLKTGEMNKVKKLGKSIIEQRSDIERFFLDSLDYVRMQVAANRQEYRKEANAIYNNRMLEAHKGNADYPKVRTFTKKFDEASTNNVYNDLEEAKKWTHIDPKVDISELTWEQKEQVLRELFARMNNKTKSKAQRSQMPSIMSGQETTLNETGNNATQRNETEEPTAHTAETNDNFTFITQHDVQQFPQDAISTPLNAFTKLPPIVSK